MMTTIERMERLLEEEREAIETSQGLLDWLVALGLAGSVVLVALMAGVLLALS